MSKNLGMIHGRRFLVLSGVYSPYSHDNVTHKRVYSKLLIKVF